MKKKNTKQKEEKRSKSYPTLVSQWTIPARHLCPWDSPGKNTGVGCHLLLQGNSPTQGLNQVSPALQADALLTELHQKAPKQRKVTCFSSVQLLNCVRLFATPWIATRQASLSITNSQSSRKLTSIESVMPSSHLILCHPLLLLPPIPPSIRVFSNESTLCMRWLKYCSFSFSIIPSKEIPGLIFRMDWLDLLTVQGTLKSLL